MKSFYLAFALSLCGITLNAALPNQGAEHIAPSVIERGPNHRIWKTVSEIKEADGKTRSKTNTFTEVQTGMYYESDGQWLESSEVIEVQGQYGIASHGQHKVKFSGQINVAQPIELTAPDGNVFKTRVLGLAFYDTSSGRSTLIAELTNSVGVIVGNQVIYQDAFTDIKADIRYTYSKGGLEQDIILPEQLPVTPEDFQLNPATTRLQVLTEFFDPPAAKSRPVQRKGMSIQGKLDFGAMKIGHGKAFAIDQQRTRSVGVDKEWLELEGRQFLIENVSLDRIKKDLNTLPVRPVASRSTKTPKKRIASISRKLPSIKPTPQKSAEMRVAANFSENKGFVVDYALLNANTTNYTFKGDTTYFVRGDLNLSGTTIIEGGAVIKYTNAAKITIFGTVDCLTEDYRPAVLTSYKDNTVGEGIAVGPPTGTYADTALSLFTGGNLQNLHIRYADTAVYSPQVCTLTDMQFVHCNKALETYATSFSARNVLMYDVTNAFCGVDSTGIAQHLTFHSGGKVLLDNYDPECTLNLTLVNSLVFGFGDWGSCTPDLDHTEYATSDPGTVFQTVGGASHYLTDESPYRDVGTTNIDADLAASITRETTYPPIAFLGNGWYTNSHNLFPQASRDNNIPDLGYHYAPLDYAFGYMFLTNATITLNPGTAVATYSPFEDSRYYGLGLGSGANLICEGTATNHIRIVRHNCVQEQATTNWQGRADSILSPWFTSIPVPTASFRFTDWYLMASPFESSFYGYYGNMPSISFRDCQFYNGLFGTTDPSLYVTNCLFVRTYTSFANYDFNPGLVVRFLNNTFIGGHIECDPGAGGTWTFTDNAFDNVSIEQFSSGITNGYNLYNGSVVRLEPTNSIGHDVIVTNYAMTNYTSLPGSPALWLKADAGVTTNASGRVTQWNDQSGNSNHASQSDTNHCPLYVSNVLNGKPAIRFDGDQSNSALGDYLHGGGDVGLSAGFTSFIVYSMADRAINEQVPVMIGVPWEFYSTRGYYIRNGFSLGSVNELAFGAWADDYGSRYIIPASTYRIWGYRLNNAMTSFDFFDTDGIYTYTDTENVSGFQTPSAGYYVGGLGPTAQREFQGDILEVVFYASPLSDSDHQLAVNYLKQKYNLAFTPYESGPLGRYYQVPNSPVINAGSTSATNVGLYHFTTQTTQVKETNSIVDIGFHYVAVDGNGKPFDTDGDGLEDYAEDADGDGSIDPNETSWTNSNSDGDGLNDGEEVALGTNPLLSKLADTNNVIRLKVFSPSK